MPGSNIKTLHVIAHQMRGKGENKSIPVVNAAVFRPEFIVVPTCLDVWAWYDDIGL